LFKYNFITIEGCIGAGKTTLANRLAADFGGNLILERFEENPFLVKFYEDQERHAFPVELYFMAERFKQLQSLSGNSRDLFQGFTITDYLFQKSLIFAGNNLQQEEAKLYRMLFDIINPRLPQPDIIIYLYAGIEQLLSNIRKRGRSFEQQIQPEYLEHIQQSYLEYFKMNPQLRVVLLDTSNLNFVDNEADYQKVIELLQENLPVGTTTR
jgi:deoxyguanosine kinase